VPSFKVFENFALAQPACVAVDPVVPAPRASCGGHSRRGRNWQARIFRHPMLQEQQADHDAQDTQHTWDHVARKLSIAGIILSPMNALRTTFL